VCLYFLRSGNSTRRNFTWISLHPRHYHLLKQSTKPKTEIMDVNHSAIVECGHYGNGLAAKCDLEPGQVIIQITNPLLLVVEEAALGTVCAQCLFQSDHLKKCTGCQVVQYCSKDCQRAAWKSTHKGECPIYRSLPQIVPTVVRGLIQLILAEPENNGTPSQPPWADLEAHMQEIKSQKEKWENIILQTRAAVEWTKSPESYMDGAAEILCLVSYLISILVTSRYACLLFFRWRPTGFV
jgi:hypothetical protein